MPASPLPKIVLACVVAIASVMLMAVLIHWIAERQSRFTLRTLLIATTLVAVVLGLVCVGAEQLAGHILM
jgi:hypothetical protein